ncbi:hypothetical protein QQP08_020364 [Theobroma cacao]|uniref:Secreted protein n=1 Tax=Theobroma cacao TaxID=3641 RepID=A0A061GH49_THECC|nr:Uncharacterized protein TCM_030379 [Theobroma cacao]WRX27877.1 hypothetical protein QQP08_020364 [Theobroma cacao]
MVVQLILGSQILRLTTWTWPSFCLAASPAAVAAQVRVSRQIKLAMAATWYGGGSWALPYRCSNLTTRPPNPSAAFQEG